MYSSFYWAVTFVETTGLYLNNNKKILSYATGIKTLMP